MDSGTYAWIVISIFFILFIGIQVRNCIHNVQCRGNSYEDMYPNYMPQTQLGQNVAPIFTIAGTQIGSGPTGAAPAYTNSGYQFTENGNKTNLNDGLPTYDEVIAQTTTSSHSIVVPTTNAVVTTSTTSGHTITTTTTSSS